MLKVTLLGTGGTQPLPDRALAAAAVTVGGRTATTFWACPVFCRPWAA